MVFNSLTSVDKPSKCIQNLTFYNTTIFVQASPSLSCNTVVRSWHFQLCYNSSGDSFNYNPVCIILYSNPSVKWTFIKKPNKPSHPNPSMCKTCGPQPSPTSPLDFHPLTAVQPHSHPQVFDVAISSAWKVSQVSDGIASLPQVQKWLTWSFSWTQTFVNCSTFLIGKCAIVPLSKPQASQLANDLHVGKQEKHV